LLQQIHRGRSQEQKPPRSSALAPSPVNPSAQALEQIGQPVDLVEDDQPVLMIGQVELWLCQLHAVHLRFQVQVDGVESLGNLERKRRLADLSRPEQGNGWVFREPAA
jgi:hypothetical protein